MKEFVKKFIEICREADLQEKIEDFADIEEDNIPLRINKENFRSFKEFEGCKKMIFVDGGNAELISTANISVQLIRTYGAAFEKKRLFSIRKENYLIVRAIKNASNSRIDYKAEFSPKYFDFEMSSFEENLREGRNRIPISRVGEIARRLCELKTANLLSGKFKDSIIILDGNLKSSIPVEQNFLEQLYNTSVKNNNVVAALSKTSQLITKNGQSLNSLLMKISTSLNLKEWCYYPIAKITDKNHQADIAIVKLHRKSKHCFNFEIYKKQSDKIEEVLWFLRENSKDPSFFGYPYGLIDADRFARISNKERDYLKTILLAQIPKRILKDFVLNDSHETLNRLAGIK
ncbi:MAG: DNA double-strand break repair nuclease NurA [Candidatus Woesearchaeota archaeon]